MTQPQALKILKSGNNVFLTGSAGTGKTFLLNKFIDYLKGKNIKVGITASTGIASTHLGGRTIHSWAGIGIEKDMDDRSVKKLIRIKDLNKRIKEAKVLVIDEISMLDSKRLDLVDRVCREVKNPFLPFGGIQVVMCGDFFQLPPVDRDQTAKFAYESYVWKEMDLKVCYLDEQFRQSDDSVFFGLLNKIRSNQVGVGEIELLRTRLSRSSESIGSDIRATKLYTHNKDIDEINDNELSRIKSEEVVYDMTCTGHKNLVNILKKGCLAPEELKLKVGAVVMFIKNNFEKGYVNGTLGKVVDFDEEDRPIIKIKNGKEIIVKQASWSIEEQDKPIASIHQFPLRLAWAITVHKSQGMSMDAAEIDLSKAFECGMGYVALSRVRTLEGICLMGINQIALRVNNFVVQKDKEFREISNRLET